MGRIIPYMKWKKTNVPNHQPVPLRSLKNNAPPDDVGRRLQGRFGRDDPQTTPRAQEATEEGRGGNARTSRQVPRNSITMSIYICILHYIEYHIYIISYIYIHIYIF